MSRGRPKANQAATSHQFIRADEVVCDARNQSSRTCNTGQLRLETRQDFLLPKSSHAEIRLLRDLHFSAQRQYAFVQAAGGDGHLREPRVLLSSPLDCRMAGLLRTGRRRLKAEADILATIFRAAIAKGSRDTGMFGLRLQRHSFDFFVQKLAVLHPEGSGDLQRIEAAFGRTLFLHLTRLDKVEQAVSLVKAEQTGLWHAAPDGTELERTAPPSAPVYNSDEIRTWYERFAAYDRAWNDWFEMQGIEPFRIAYEALSADPLGSLRKVLSRLGLKCGAASGITPGVEKLADATNHEWATRFRLEHNIA